MLYRLYCWLKVSIDAKKDGVLTTQNKRRDRRRVWVGEGCVKVCTNGWYAWACDAWVSCQRNLRPGITGGWAAG